MYELVVRRKFSAAHQLRGYEGKCEALHGHTYAIEVYIRAEKLNNIGLAVDFKKLKEIIDNVLERYDHSFINQVPPFDEQNPSAENMARVIYGEVNKDLPEGAALARVMLWESEDAGAAYFEE